MSQQVISRGEMLVYQLVLFDTLISGKL